MGSRRGSSVPNQPTASLNQRGTPHFRELADVQVVIPLAFGGQRSIQLSYGRAMRLDSESARWQQWPCGDGGKRWLLRQRSQVRILSGARVGTCRMCAGKGGGWHASSVPPGSACGYAAALRTTGRPYRKILQALIAGFADLGKSLAFGLRIRGPAAALDSG